MVVEAADAAAVAATAAAAAVLHRWGQSTLPSHPTTAASAGICAFFLFGPLLLLRLRWLVGRCLHPLGRRRSSLTPADDAAPASRAPGRPNLCTYKIGHGHKSEGFVVSCKK